MTLFDELLLRAFEQWLADHLPNRVLPVSTEAPQDILALVDSEYFNIAELLKPGRRARGDARAKIRTLLALEAHVAEDNEGQPFRRELIGAAPHTKLAGSRGAHARATGFGSVSFVPHTHDIEMTTDVVRKTFVSWSQGEAEREWLALVHLDEHAPGLAPRPIAQFDVAGRPAVVMSRVPGDPLSGALSSRQTVALGRALRRLFAAPIPPQLPLRANDPGNFHMEIRSWLARNYEWSRCQDPSLVRRAVEVACSWLERHQPAEDWLVDPVIALGDGNLDNVLWDGEECRLIDWEEYGVSDLCYELADVVEHASSRLERRLNIDALLAEFTLDIAQRERLDHHRRMFACFWLAKLLPGNGGWDRNPPGSIEKQARWVIEVAGNRKAARPAV